MAKIEFSFSLESKCSATEARAGTFTTAHSIVETPVFMPVATHAALRGQNIAEVQSIGFKTLLANTYHLLLRPGPAVFEKFGGIHPFMGWPQSILTDSGGFQLFSLADHTKMSEEGAEFRSYIDGLRVLLTPEVSISTQRSINSDIMMVLDHCIPALSDRVTTEAAMHLTHRWAKRSLDARGDSSQALFGIAQGGCFLDLRRQSADQITSLPFDGYAIGGVAVGEEKSVREDIVEYTAKLLPQDRPRYLMGVGTPIDLLEGVARGIDMFDCIIPTALAAQGRCFTSEGKMNLTRGVYAGSMDAIENSCPCSTCSRHTRGYLHHLIKAGEFLAHTLVGIHNLTFYFRLMSEIRSHIKNDSFQAYYGTAREKLGQSESEFPVSMQRSKRSTQEQVGDYTLHRHNSLISVKQVSSGEVMHSVSDPLVEAEQLYVGQSNLRERVKSTSKEPLIVWDVGLGAATNAMAAINAYEALTRDVPILRPLTIVSFENDLDSLRLALKHPAHFSQVRHAAPATLLRDKLWKSTDQRMSWKLLEGDFLDTLEQAETPDVIFYDPFSYKTNSRLWSLECFKRLFKVCKTGTTLYTYSASTGIRAGLLVAGFYVARGVGAGPKADTTMAVKFPAADGGVETGDSDSQNLLDSRWLSRWERSDNKYPPGLELSEQAVFNQKILLHPQFRAQ